MTDEVKIICVDFDRTLCDPDNKPPDKRLGPPFPGAKEAMQAFREAGYDICIHSCRGSDGPRAVKVMVDWLNYFQIPFDSVWGQPGKPVADFYIDDLAIRFEGNWEDTKRKVLNG